MANSDVEKLKTDLQQCEDELVDMRKMHEKLLNLIASAEGIKLKETDGKECVFQYHGTVTVKWAPFFLNVVSTWSMVVGP